MTNSASTIYQLTVHGSLTSKTLEAARAMHNQTAGDPGGVAAAKSLGDLSHMVYIPADHPGPEASELLILDLWNSLEGLNTFFMDPQVQHGGGLMFSQREPVVWAPAEGFFTYHLPAPTGMNNRLVGVARGLLRSRSEGLQTHNALIEKNINKARACGSLSHEAYFRLAQPGAPETLEFFSVDVWMSPQGMEEFYDQPGFMSSFDGMFSAPPTEAVWIHPAGEWVEW